MIELECPYCHNKFSVEDYSNGNCTKCDKYYYWYEDWDYINEEMIYSGFYWD